LVEYQDRNFHQEVHVRQSKNLSCGRKNREKKESNRPGSELAKRKWRDKETGILFRTKSCERINREKKESNRPGSELAKREWRDKETGILFRTKSCERIKVLPISAGTPRKSLKTEMPAICTII